MLFFNFERQRKVFLLKSIAFLFLINLKTLNFVCVICSDTF